MTRRTTHTTTIQLWPGGQSYTYRGDLDGPANQRSLRIPGKNGEPDGRWVKGTPEEWRQIRINTRAELYGRREILCCDSGLVDDLIANAHGQNGDLASAFEDDRIENLYPDPSDWDAEQCREWLTEHTNEGPPHSVRRTVCAGCGLEIEGMAPFDPHEWRDRGNNRTCGADGVTFHAPETHPNDEDDITEALRAAVRDHATAAEVYEWWRVSEWLCDRLREIGEVVIDNGYGHWWGRTVTGQAWIMDGTLQQVAARLEDEVS